MSKPRARYSPEYELLLSRLIEARKAAGVTQHQIAGALGKPQSHVSKCENQDREISIVDLRLWCQALGVKVGDFVRDWDATVDDEARKSPNGEHR